LGGEYIKIYGTVHWPSINTYLRTIISPQYVGDEGGPVGHLTDVGVGDAGAHCNPLVAGFW